MNKPVFYFLLASIGILSLCRCSKNSNNYTTTDHTAQVTVPHAWKGTIYGYYKSDTTFPPDTTHREWAKLYNLAISDTSIIISKIDGYAVSVFGVSLSYRLTDSVNKTLRFDSVVTGALNCILYYQYVKDSMSLEYHVVTGVNPISGQYYQENVFLHTH